MRKLMKFSVGAALTAMVLFAPSTFAETSTSPSGEVMGVSEEENAVGSLRVRINAGDLEELRFVLKNSEDEFAEFEENTDDGNVFQVKGWKPPETDPETDESVVLSIISDTFEIVGLRYGDYKLIPLDKDFTVENGGEKQDYILIGAGEYEFTISPVENPTESEFSEESDSEELEQPTDPEETEQPNESEETGQPDEPAEIAEVQLDYTSKSLTLPDTGGIGTGVFYIVGGTMIAVSAMMLIARFKNRKK